MKQSHFSSFIGLLFLSGFHPEIALAFPASVGHGDLTIRDDSPPPTNKLCKARIEWFYSHDEYYGRVGQKYYTNLVVKHAPKRFNTKLDNVGIDFFDKDDKQLSDVLTRNLCDGSHGGECNWLFPEKEWSFSVSPQHVDGSAEKRYLHMTFNDNLRFHTGKDSLTGPDDKGTPYCITKLVKREQLMVEWVHENPEQVERERIAQEPRMLELVNEDGEKGGLMIPGEPIVFDPPQDGTRWVRSLRSHNQIITSSGFFYQ